MCVSTALQKSLEHILFEEMHKNISLCVWTLNTQIIHAGIGHFSNPFWESSMKIQLLAKAFSLKSPPWRPLGQTLFVECDRHCSYFSG